MNIEDLYVKEISADLELLDELEVQSEEYGRAVDGIAKLTDKLIGLRKLVIEQQQMEDEHRKLDIEQQRMEIERKKLDIEQQRMEIEPRKLDIEQQQMEDERKDRKVKNRLGIANLAVPTCVTGIGMVLILIYESKGTIFSGRVSGKIIERVFRMK